MISYGDSTGWGVDGVGAEQSLHAVSEKRAHIQTSHRGWETPVVIHRVTVQKTAFKTSGETERRDSK